MKTIIAPIDFSEVSQNALWFAAELSKRTGARLVIVNILQEGDDGVAANENLKDITTNLQDFFGSEWPCEATVAEGSLISTLKGLIGFHHPDLLVMGTKGASGLKRILIGSNTVKVLANVQVPVLVIPEVAKFEQFIRAGKNRVVLATDLFELQNDSGLDILQEIASLMEEPKIKVVSIRPEKTKLDDLKRMERRALLSRFKPEIPTERVTIFSKSVMGGINFYLNKHEDTGLVAMVARDSGNLIQKHYTREMASHTEYPLLVLHDGPQT